MFNIQQKKNVNSDFAFTNTMCPCPLKIVDDNVKMNQFFSFEWLFFYVKGIRSFCNCFQVDSINGKNFGSSNFNFSIFHQNLKVFHDFSRSIRDQVFICLVPISLMVGTSLAHSIRPFRCFFQRNLKEKSSFSCIFSLYRGKKTQSFFFKKFLF